MLLSARVQVRPASHGHTRVSRWYGQPLLAAPPRTPHTPPLHTRELRWTPKRYCGNKNKYVPSTLPPRPPPPSLPPSSLSSPYHTRSPLLPRPPTPSLPVLCTVLFALRSRQKEDLVPSAACTRIEGVLVTPPRSPRPTARVSSSAVLSVHD